METRQYFGLINALDFHSECTPDYMINIITDCTQIFLVACQNYARLPFCIYAHSVGMNNYREQFHAVSVRMDAIR